MTEQDDAQDVLERDEDGDPAVAFDALRRIVEGTERDLTREMTTIRKSVELALDQCEAIGPAADYRPEFARLVQQLSVVAERLDSVEKLPVLRQGAEHYARVFERSGTDLVSAATRKLEASMSALDRTARVLADQVESARERRRQKWGCGQRRRGRDRPWRPAYAVRPAHSARSDRCGCRFDGDERAAVAGWHDLDGLR